LLPALCAAAGKANAASKDNAAAWGAALKVFFISLSPDFLGVYKIFNAF
jgi:hypothetical protein